MNDRTAPARHSIISPSSASRWLRCPGSVPFTKDMPDRSSKDADFGTLCHDLAARLLIGDQDPERLKTEAGEEVWDAVQEYVAAVQAAAQGGTLLVEHEIDLSKILCLPDGIGTTDAAVIQPGVLEVHDLKTGYQPVYAKENEQLMIYAAGLVDELHFAGYKFDKVKIVIHQPRVKPVEEWEISVGDLLRWAVEVMSKAQLALNMIEMEPGQWIFNPGEKQCQWCRGKAQCKALANKVGEEISMQFDDLESYEIGVNNAVEQTEKVSTFSNEELARKFAAIKLIENWIKAVEEETLDRLVKGDAVPGYKLVAGRKGARAWLDPKQAEETLKKMRLKTEEMYSLEVISPTRAEALHKAGVIGPRQWPQLQALFGQAEGKPSVAPEHDKRPAISMAAKPEEFDDLA